MRFNYSRNAIKLNLMYKKLYESIFSYLLLEVGEEMSWKMQRRSRRPRGYLVILRELRGSRLEAAFQFAEEKEDSPPAHERGRSHQQVYLLYVSRLLLLLSANSNNVYTVSTVSKGERLRRRRPRKASGFIGSLFALDERSPALTHRIILMSCT